MSVEETLDVDVEVDEDGNVAHATVRDELDIEELFDEHGELRLWQGDDWWEGFVRKNGQFYYKNTKLDSWISFIRVGERSVRESIKGHIENPAAGGAGRFVRGCSPP